MRGNLRHMQHYNLCSVTIYQTHLIISHEIEPLRAARISALFTVMERTLETAEFDYVVVGGGTAGCVVAARLTESGSYRVALLEAGGEDNSFWIHAPIGYGKLYDRAEYNWLYESEPEPGLENNKNFLPRGKVLGGTSSINGMIYVRGQREDFDYWRQLGNVGWSYEDVLPYFKKSEDNDLGSGPYHGTGGPLGVSSVPRHELADAFIDAGLHAGYSRNWDFNGETQDGFGYNQITTRRGRRSSSAVAYLRPARGRKNLKVITHAMVSRILFDRGRAVGVVFKKGNSTHTLRPRREIILCGGSFNSPQLLQISGVGPADLLRGHGIPLVANMPGVGSGLQDHFTVGTTYRCSLPITINDLVNSPIRRLKAGLQYLVFRSGPMASNANVVGGCIRTDPSLVAPDVKLQMRLWSRSVSGRARERMGLHKYSAFGVTLTMLHPDNKGSVRIKSTDPAVQPEIRFNYFVSERDKRTALSAIRTIRDIMSTPPMAPYVEAEIRPGSEVNSDRELIEYCAKNGTTNHHPTSTCRMGTDDSAVVDPRLRLRGLSGIRVVDASVMPAIVGGNTQAATIMIAEKGSTMILEDARK